MRLRISNFCGLSRNADWHLFLEQVAPNILNDLQAFLKSNTGCRSAKDKMLAVYRELYSIGKGNDFESFIRKRFPYIIESDDNVPITSHKSPAKPKPKPKLVTPSGMNKHGVFKNYNPGMLTFPHKLILVDADSEQLLRRTKEFLRDKVTIDYIILNDTAYLEYLMKKYEDIAGQIPAESKEIQQFRKKMAQK
jgi:hypothetical protein